MRLKRYDYSKDGAYFVTILTRERECLFGEIYNGKMILNDAGKMVQKVWDEIPKFYEGITIDAFQIMPNHVHGIVTIVRAGPRACPDPIKGNLACRQGRPQGVALTVSDIVHRFKTLTTKMYIDGVDRHHWPSFNRRLWHRNYYEHIIRDEQSLGQIRQYIINNPCRWHEDELFAQHR